MSTGHFRLRMALWKRKGRSRKPRPFLKFSIPSAAKAAVTRWITARLKSCPPNSLPSSTARGSDAQWLRLLRELILSEALQAVAQASLKDRRRVRVESHEIPQRLAAIAAQPRQSRRVGVRVARHVFANRAVGVLRQLVQSLGIRAGMLADQAEQIKVGLRSLLDQLFEHFRLRIGA